jgi:hypothetical protein
MKFQSVFSAFYLIQNDWGFHLGMAIAFGLIGSDYIEDTESVCLTGLVDV